MEEIKKILPQHFEISNGYIIFDADLGCEFFASKGDLYVRKDKKYISLITEADVDRYVLHQLSNHYYNYTVVGFKKDIPILVAYYKRGSRELAFECRLEKILDGYMIENEISHIYIANWSNHKRIIIIDATGKVILDVGGNNCHKKNYKGSQIYLIEKEEDRIELYDILGKKIV